MKNRRTITCPGCGAVIDLDTHAARFTADNDDAPEGEEIDPGDGAEAGSDPGDGSGQGGAPEAASEAPRRRNRFWR